MDDTMASEVQRLLTPCLARLVCPGVWTSVGTLGFLNKELPFHGEKQAHRAQLALLGVPA